MLISSWFNLGSLDESPSRARLKGHPQSQCILRLLSEGVQGKTLTYSLDGSLQTLSLFFWVLYSLFLWSFLSLILDVFLLIPSNCLILHVLLLVHLMLSFFHVFLLTHFNSILSLTAYTPQQNLSGNIKITVCYRRIITMNTS